MWNFTSSAGSPLSSVRYGVLPDGFNQGGEVQGLTPGERVNVSVDARGGTSGGVDVDVTE